jgi:hypothetical protein
VDREDLTAHAWREAVSRRGADEDRAREALGRLIERDPDPAEVGYYEAVSDPDARAIEKTQRSHAGQYRRHVRRLNDGARHGQ